MKRSIYLLGSLLVWLALPTVVARAQTSESIKPHFLVIVDNSGSMDTCTDGTGNFMPDCVGLNSCGQPKSRMNDAKCVLSRIVSSYGDAIFGLLRYRQTCAGVCGAGPLNPDECLCDGPDASSPCACSGPNDCGACDPDAADEPSSMCPATGADAMRGEVLVPLRDQNHAEIVEWVNFSCGGCASPPTVDPELTYGDGSTWTPLAGSLAGAKLYYEGGDPNFASPIASDPYASCRPHYVILLTDGAETCALRGKAVTAATALRATTVSSQTFDIRTFVVALGASGDPFFADQLLEDLALAGGTDSPDPTYRAFHATDESSLALAFSQIIGASLLSERCNGIDDDCDGACDETYPEVAVSAVPAPGQSCSNPRSAATCTVGVGVCARSGVFVCSQSEQGVVCLDPDTNQPPVPGVGGPEVCPPNGLDDDCNGIVDDIMQACDCAVEVCNGEDDDCDGTPDELSDIFPCPREPNPQGCICPTGSCGDVDNLPSCHCPPPCGFTLGECREGVYECAGAALVCTGTGPQQEQCDGYDNDCDGTIDDNVPGSGGLCFTFGSDLQRAPPAICRNGIVRCVDSGGGPELTCVGELGPDTEICNGIDDDCDGMVDDGAPCPNGSSCVGGSCVPSCTLSETPCPADRRCVDPFQFADCYPPSTECVCYPNLCAGGGPCDRASQTCVIRGGLPVCEDRCPPGRCAPPARCEPLTGRCLDCYSEGCRGGQICVGGACQDDPCAQTACSDRQFCRNGACVPLCDVMTCGSGMVCEAGECRDSPCASVACGTGTVCNPTTGDCRANPCVLACPGRGSRCVPATGRCAPDPCETTRCPACYQCALTFEGAADCVPIAGCKLPAAFRFTPAGGGGFTCDMAAGSRPRGSAGLLLFALLLLIYRARRRVVTSCKMEARPRSTEVIDA